MNEFVSLISIILSSLICDLSTEIMGMRLRSVGAGQLAGDYRRQHFALESAQG